MKLNIFVKVLVISTLIAGSSYAIKPIEAEALSTSSKPVLEQGDQEGFVWDLQHRLNQLNLYNAKVDGIFGPITEKAVVQFQRNYSLTPDGIVGKNTWMALYSQTITADEIKTMAKIVHGEARGESFEGKVAVASVILNRVASSDFPNSINGVIFEPYAFTAVADGQYYATPNDDAYRAVLKAIQGWDPSYGSVFYFNPVTAESKWLYTRQVVKRIGEHVFLK